MPRNDGTGPFGDGRGGRGLGPCGRGARGRGAGAGLGRRGGLNDRSQTVYPYDKESLQAQKQELEEQMKRLTEELNKG